MPIVRTAEVTLSCDDLGEGEPVFLLLPGWCSSRAVFQPLLPLLSARRRTIALDWRGHGSSGRVTGEFGEGELVSDALAILEASGAGEVIPVALAHAGWVAIELRRRLGKRIARIALIEWFVLGAPPPFLDALHGMRSKDRWRATVDATFDRWLLDVEAPRLTRFVRDDMGSYDYEMWARAAKAIEGAFAEHGSPLKALADLAPACPVLHLYAQPDDPRYLADQEGFAAEHDWFRVQRLGARSHFPMFEAAEEMASALEAFAAGSPSAS